MEAAPSQGLVSVDNAVVRPVSLPELANARARGFSASVQNHAVAGVDSHVAGVVHEVTGASLRCGNTLAHARLGGRTVRKVNAVLAVHPRGEARAIPTRGGATTENVRNANSALRCGEDRAARHRRVRRVLNLGFAALALLFRARRLALLPVGALLSVSARAILIVTIRALLLVAVRTIFIVAARAATLVVARVLFAIGAGFGLFDLGNGRFLCDAAIGSPRPSGPPVGAHSGNERSEHQRFDHEL